MTVDFLIHPLFSVASQATFSCGLWCHNHHIKCLEIPTVTVAAAKPGPSRTKDSQHVFSCNMSILQQSTLIYSITFCHGAVGYQFQDDKLTCQQVFIHISIAAFYRICTSTIVSSFYYANLTVNNSGRLQSPNAKYAKRFAWSPKTYHLLGTHGFGDYSHHHIQLT